jgi:hypothetical protein
LIKIVTNLPEQRWDLLRERVENAVAERENCFHDNQVEQALQVLDPSLIISSAHEWDGDYQSDKL